MQRVGVGVVLLDLEALAVLVGGLARHGLAQRLDLVLQLARVSLRMRVYGLRGPRVMRRVRQVDGRGGAVGDVQGIGDARDEARDEEVCADRRARPPLVVYVHVGRRARVCVRPRKRERVV
ncbi:hypothetical protein GLX27_001679 [Malassezia furfur]|uniref:Secreted protein n=1 Tax=Malassezia furfur TaxID=55194 RepID=A0ABY8ENA5_MALFU|nr:hypothetical protein GLX27_001679 [Malassezia furfur]